MLTVGTYIADRYEIISKVGAGGMSDVYKAKDHKLGRFVAIKILKPEFVDDVNFVTKFRTEAQSAASLEHPNIVNIYDVGSENGLHYIIMEYVEGITLKSYIERKGQLQFKEAVSISIQVARGIEAAHNKNIIHRDIKPQNIMISTEGKVKVTDFGIARAATSNTINADVMGSVHYSSPEQARNGFVDGRSDIYSLGIAMYEMVTGRVPFDGDTTVAVAIQHLQEEMVIPSVYAPTLPISMEKIILKCTQKSPDRRYQSVQELLADLRQALVSPDDDFVTMIPINNQEKTRVITAEEVSQINREADRARAKDLEFSNLSEEAEDANRDELEEMEDELEQQGILNPKMEKAVTIMGIVATVVIVAVIIYFVGVFLGIFHTGSSSKNHSGNKTENSADAQSGQSGHSSHSSQGTKDAEDSDGMEMIDLKGMTVDEAKEALEKAGFTNTSVKEMGRQASDEFEEGRIVSQNPEKGKKIEKDAKIKVILSAGPDVKEVAVPGGLVGMTEGDAKAALENVGLACEINYEYNDETEAGKVIWTDPGSGTTLTEGSMVTLGVSQGKEPLNVPDVTSNGVNESEARERIEAAGFVVGAVTTAYNDSIPEGIVISQSLTPGTQAEKGRAIDLVISMGPEKVSYSMSQRVSVPSNEHNYVSAQVTLLGSDGNVIKAYDSYRLDASGFIDVSASNITNASSGMLQIEWRYEDVIDDGEDDFGNPITHQESGSTQTTVNVVFTKE